jgi:nucleotide-binding universal stress UspA family protein
MPDDRLRLLVPLDGSPESESILPALLPLLRSRPVDLSLLRVAAREEPVRDLRYSMDRLRKNLLLDGIQARTFVEWGSPAEEILYYAKESWCNLVAMTTHGRTGLRRVFLGSVAEQVVRRSSVPVLVNRPWNRAADWSRIVLPLDGSARAEAAVPDAIGMGRLRRATVHVLGVLPRAVLYGGHADAAIGPRGPSRRYLESVCDRLAGEGVLAVADVREGPAAPEITRHAEQLNAGLVCMATHGRTGLARMLTGSTTEEVLRTAPCPVFVRRAVPAAIGALRATA